MKSDVQREINKLLQAENAFEEARKNFLLQRDVVFGNLLECPVCHSYAKVAMEFGEYEIRCKNCHFHAGRSNSLKTMLDRWTAICDALEEMEKEEVKECE